MKVYKFADCYLDTIERRVFKSGLLLDITPRAFEILLLLVETSGRIVTKQELIEKIWHGSFIEEGNIPVHISKLRKLLRASREEPFIETVSGSGYSFVCRVGEVSQPEWKRYLAQTGKIQPAAAARSEKLDSIAVLPFHNSGESREYEYLAEGVTESIINNLSYIAELKVIARNTVFRFQGSQMNAEEIGEMLGVAAVLTGRIRVLGENIVVGVELMKVSDGTQVWGEQFNQPLSDIFEIQERIACSISEKLKVKISDLAKRSIQGQLPQNVKAYALYLKGRHFWVKKNIEDINTAIKYFQESISLNFHNVAAYVGLADCYISLYQLEQLSLKQVLALVSTILKLFEGFNEKSPEIIAIEGYSKFILEWDWENAEKLFQKSLILNPGNVILRYRYAHFLALAGRFTESFEQHQQALLLDPLSKIINVSLGRIFYLMDQYDNAITQLRETLELDHENHTALLLLGCALTSKGKYSEALNIFEIAQKLQQTTELNSLIGCVYALSGFEHKARRIIKVIKNQVNSKNVDATNVAYIYLSLGEPNKALEYLEKAFSQRSQDLLGIKVDPRLKPLRQHPQFRDLARRVGLPID